MGAANPPRLFLDIAPLWELQFTGIANVVSEVAASFLNKKSPVYDVRFTAFGRVIDREVVATCLAERNGRRLQAAVHSGAGCSWLKQGDIDYNRDCGLYLHVKPVEKRFRREAMLIYDLSYLSVPETHAIDTINFHTEGLSRQIASTDLFFCISESTGKDLRWYFGVDERNIAIAYLGHNVDVRAAEVAKSRIGSREVEQFALILGTIEPRKNSQLVLQWLGQTPRVLQDNRFVFVGRQGWGPGFADIIAQCGLREPYEQGRILHLGYVSEAQKAALISTTRVMIYPSIFEGFGLPVLEAMVLGVPILSSCSTSLPEVLGPDGYYFDPYSVASLDEAYRALLADQDNGYLRDRISKLRLRSNNFSYRETFQIIESEICNRFFT